MKTLKSRKTKTLAAVAAGVGLTCLMIAATPAPAAASADANNSPGPVSSWAYSAPVLGSYAQMTDANGNPVTNPAAPKTPADYTRFGDGGRPTQGGAASESCINPSFSLASGSPAPAQPGSLPAASGPGQYTAPALNVSFNFSLAPDPAQTYTGDILSTPCAQQLGLTGEIYPVSGDAATLTVSKFAGPGRGSPTFSGSTTGTATVSGVANAADGAGWPQVDETFWAHTTSGSQVLVSAVWVWPEAHLAAVNATRIAPLGTTQHVGLSDLQTGGGAWGFTSIAPAGPLPSGAKMSPDSSEISYTPSAVGNVVVPFKLTDPSGVTSQPATLTLITPAAGSQPQPAPAPQPGPTPAPAPTKAVLPPVVSG